MTVQHYTFNNIQCLPNIKYTRASIGDTIPGCNNTILRRHNMLWSALNADKKLARRIKNYNNRGN